MGEMKARIDTRFASAKETARVLGVPKSRLRKLVRLADSLIPERNGSGPAHSTSVRRSKALQGNFGLANHRLKDSASNATSSHRKQKASKKSGSNHKRRARAKVAKTLR